MLEAALTTDSEEPIMARTVTAITFFSTLLLTDGDAGVYTRVKGKLIHAAGLNTI